MPKKPCMKEKLPLKERSRLSWLQGAIITAMLFQVARAEEESMMTGATVVEDDGRVYS